MYGARKASLKIVFFKHICAFFSVRGNIGAICSFDNPDPDSDTEGSTRTMRLLKLHYHQQQVSSWSLFFCTIFETNKQTNKQTFVILQLITELFQDAMRQIFLGPSGKFQSWIFQKSFGINEFHINFLNIRTIMM